MSKVEVYQQREHGIVKLGVKVHDPRAHLADLLQAWQPLCDGAGIYKQYGNNGCAPCRGCVTNCCNTAYVIPDLISFKRMAAWLGQEEADFLAGWFQSDKLARGLLRLQPNPCIFLQDRVCTVYPLRSLICRFYLCSPLLGETEQLIYSIAWSGAAATQLYAEQKGYLPRPSQGGFTSFDLLFVNMLEEYRYHPGVQLFLTAHDYQDIPLAPFCHEVIKESRR